MSYEYQVIPAPERGQKARGAKTPDARYAAALAQVLNEEAAQGWEFQRAEVLPSQEKQGLTGTRTVYVNVLVFRRARPSPARELPAEAAAETAVSPA
ncbi:DUF4177 domain-containing protein [Mangrovicoccus algicola]|uniref:DUF4177 domain-containing protein n=1 Tax=Mangrovicoccus algicola TaxID=2771008 RepID=A0A8J7CWP9_9RHOB|nr:DUF4177 domain-containing protein [Mangrovicoccus algicola]MBE3639839.1 DUF4177 domain-containing protein [Mangrovicoccus algicola]